MHLTEEHYKAIEMLEGAINNKPAAMAKLALQVKVMLTERDEEDSEEE